MNGYICLVHQHRLCKLSPEPLFIKVCLEHSHVDLFTLVCDYFDGIVETETVGLGRPKIFAIWSFAIKAHLLLHEKGSP